MIRFAIACFWLGCAAVAGAQSWQRLGPEGGMVTALAAAADGAVYLGTPDGHIFASTDAGTHWELRGRAGGRLDGVVQRIVADGKDSQRLLAAMWFRNSPGGGVFESRDSGRRWKLVGLDGEEVRAIEHSESDRKVWVAGSRRGVFLSKDDARTWERITDANDPELQNVDSLAIDPRDPQTIYAGTYHLPWKTSDGGKTWHSIATGMIDDSDIMSLRIDAQNPRRIFSSACSGIYRSEDAGATWTKLQGVPYSSRRTQQIVQSLVDPQVLYAATTEGLWITEDGGETWKRATPRETDANSVVILRTKQGQRVLAGFDAQGILLSDDGGQSFKPSNAGFSHPVMLSLAVDPREQQHFLALAEGIAGGLLESRDQGATWLPFSGGSPAKPVTKLMASRVGWWAALAGGGVARFDAGRNTWREVAFRERPGTVRSQSASTRAAHLAPAKGVSPTVVSLQETPGMVLAATEDGLWQLDLCTGEFRRRADRNAPSSVSFLAATSSGALQVIANQQPWIGDRQGGEWQHLGTRQEGGGALWLSEVVLGSERRVLLGTRRGLFVFEPDTATWRLLANGLPAIEPESATCVGTACLAAMRNGGLYESSDGLKTWQRVDSEAESGKVEEMMPGVGGTILVVSRSEGVLRYVPRSGF